MKKVTINQKAEALQALTAILNGEAEFSDLYKGQWNQVVSSPYAKNSRPTTELATKIAHTAYRRLIAKHGNDCLFYNRLGNLFTFDTVIDSFRRVIQDEIKKERAKRIEVRPDTGFGKVIVVPE